MHDAVECKEWGEWRYLMGTTGRGGTHIVVDGSHIVTATHDDGSHQSHSNGSGRLLRRIFQRVSQVDTSS